MAVEVRVTSLLQKQLQGKRSVMVEGKTVGEALDNLERAYPGVKGLVLSEDGRLHRFVNIFLNDEDVRFVGELEAPVSDGDVIAIMPALAGGS